uniref:Metalloendopeptidase n=1 Tax=Lepeophtheirus salmonis TaxID=72036 RepID=A0A0K2UU33_LEPSM
MITYILLLTVCSILIPPYQAEGACNMMLDKHNRAEMMSRSFVFGSNNLWPNKQVPYTFGASLTSNERSSIRSAMNIIESRSCVRFVPRSSQKNFVKIRNNMIGCFASAIGFNPNREQLVVNLARRVCMSQAIITHELFHALGFLHEQNRPDRDEFIRVSWNNITPLINRYYQFARARAPGENIALCNFRRRRAYTNCYNGMTSTTLGLTYDYISVMQYSRTAFSWNGRPTLTATRDGGSTLGNRVGMSTLDVQKLNKAYQCSGETSCGDRYTTCSNFKKYCTRFSFLTNNCKLTCNKC